MKELLHVLPPPPAPVAREWRHYTLFVQHGRYTGGGGIYINRVRECDKMQEKSSDYYLFDQFFFFGFVGISCGRVMLII